MRSPPDSLIGGVSQVRELSPVLTPPDEATRRTFPSKRVVVWYLAILLVAALGIRAWWASGWPNAWRVWDERYSFANVRHVIVAGSLEPVRNFYPSPVYYLPPALVIQAARPFVEDPDSSLFDPATGEFHPAAYWLARSTQVVYGTAGVALIYLLGTIMFDRRVGLLAATTLAFLPWHIQVSGVFKPDAQVVFFLLLVFLAGVRWMRSPSALAAMGVGGAVALATSSKLIAGVAGAAFGLAALVRARGYRQYAQVVLAGVVSVGLFLLLNPHLDIVLEGIDDIKKDYAQRARWAGMTKAQIPLRTLAYLLEPTVLGPALGALALAGYVGLWITGLRAIPTRPAEVAGPRLMLAAFPLLYVMVHTAQSAWFRDNNFTHILPTFVIAFSWIAVVLLAAAFRRWRPPRPVRAAAVVGLGLLLVPPGVLFVYRTYTPSTLDSADLLVRAIRPRLHGRVVILEPVEARGVPWKVAKPLAQKGFAVVRVRSADDLPHERRARSDAEILRGKRSPAELSAPAEALTVIRPELGLLRGPTLTVLDHRWRRGTSHGPLPARRDSSGDFEIEVPPIDEQHSFSVAISVRRSPDLTPDESPSVRYGDDEVPLHRANERHNKFSLVSERLHSAGPVTQTARITDLPGLPASRLRFYVYTWRPPGPRRSAEPLPLPEQVPGAPEGDRPAGSR